MEGIDLRNVVTTVYNEFLKKDSGIAAQFRWGDNERVRFCDSVEEMERYSKELNFPGMKSSRHVISFDEEHQLLPYEILSTLELANWRKPDTIALVKLNKKSLKLKVGAKASLKATKTGTKKPLKWSSSDKRIATVSQKGEITGKKAGTATITAKRPRLKTNPPKRDDAANGSVGSAFTSSMNMPPRTITSSFSATMITAISGSGPQKVCSTIAVSTISLSASGSNSLPKSVIWFSQ